MSEECSIVIWTEKEVICRFNAVPEVNLVTLYVSSTGLLSSWDITSEPMKPSPPSGPWIIGLDCGGLRSCIHGETMKIRAVNIQGDESNIAVTIGVSCAPILAILTRAQTACAADIVQKHWYTCHSCIGLAED